MKKVLSVLLALCLLLAAGCEKGSTAVKKPGGKSDNSGTVSDQPNGSEDAISDAQQSEKITRVPFSTPDRTTQSINETSSSYVKEKVPFTDKKPYSNAAGYVEASNVVTKNGRTYIEHNGKPYVMHCIRIRTDRIVTNSKMLSKKQWDVYLREYFRQAAQLGFNCVSFEIIWKNIEPAEDLYDFSLYDSIYSYCEEFGLNVQLIWMGSDNCGYYSVDVPTYITRDTVNYPRCDYICKDGRVIKNAYMNYSTPKLIEREKKALNKLLQHLYEYDTERRTVAIQILNEANDTGVDGGGLPAYAAVSDWSNREEVKAKTWVQGQREAILNLMNELGMCVKKGPYRCVTRYNFVSYSCYNYAENSPSYDDSVRKVFDLPGIDIVGMDCFDTGLTMDNYFMTRVAGFKGNVPHIPETCAGIYTAFAKQLNAFKLGGGLIFYEVRGNENDDKLSLFRLDDYKFTYRDGTQSVGSVLEASTKDWISFNNMVKNAGYMLMTSKLDDFVPFNVTTVNPSIVESRTVGDYKITFNTTSNADYGAVGFAMRAADGSYLFYSQKGTGTFSFDNATLNGKIEKGYYNDSGKWIKTGEIAKTGNGFIITPNQAEKGSVFRITTNQLS